MSAGESAALSLAEILTCPCPAKLRRSGRAMLSLAAQLRQDLSAQLDRAVVWDHTELLSLERVAVAAEQAASAAYLLARKRWNSSGIKSEREMRAYAPDGLYLKRGSPEFLDAQKHFTPEDLTSLNFELDQFDSMLIVGMSTMDSSAQEVWLRLPSRDPAYFHILTL